MVCFLKPLSTSSAFEGFEICDCGSSGPLLLDTCLMAFPCIPQCCFFFFLNQRLFILFFFFYSSQLNMNPTKQKAVSYPGKSHLHENNAYGLGRKRNMLKKSDYEIAIHEEMQ